MQHYADLGIRVDSTPVQKARDEFGRFVKAGAAAEGAAENFGRAGTNAGRAVQQSSVSMAAAFRQVASAAGAVAGALAAAFSMRAVVAGIAEFDAAMSEVGAITRATERDLARMREVAKDLGATTEFSAAQAAGGLKFLGMAGFTAAESMAALPRVLDLATASGMGLAQAADVTSNIMSAFGIEAQNASAVTDVLAAASTRANTSVEQLGSAISRAGPVAQTLGVDIEETAAAIGVMSDAGIQGERAGTALVGTFASLAGPTTAAQEALARYGLTADDVNPASRDLADILDTLRGASISTADAMTIFGREAAAGALVMIQAAPRFREFTGELRQVEGATAAMAAQMRDNLRGDLQGLGSAVQALVIELGEAGLAGALRAAIQGMTEFVRAVADNVVPILRTMGVVITTLAGTQIPALVAALTTKAAAMTAAAAATGALNVALGVLRAALFLVGGPFGLLAGLASGAAAAFVLFRQDADDLSPAMRDAAAGTTALNEALAVFYSTAAPSAATSAIDVARANRELAASAYEAANAELAKAEAMLRAAQGRSAEALDPYSALYNSNEITRAMEGYRTALDLVASSRELLSQREREGERAARAVTGATSEAATAADALNRSVTVTVEGVEGLGDALGSAGGAASGAASAVHELGKEWRDRTRTSAERAAEQVEELNGLLRAGAIDAETYRRAMALVGEELAGAQPMVGELADAFADFVTRGFKDFDGFAKSVVGVFRNMLRNMIAMAAQNRISISMGLGAVGGAGGAAGAAGQIASGAGMLGQLGGIGGVFGNILGSFGTGGGIAGLAGGTGFLGGVGNVIGGFASGGFGGAFSAIGTALKGATTGLAGFAGAVGALAVPLGIVGLAVAAFRKKTVETGRGLEVTIRDLSAEVRSYQNVRETRFFGLSRRNRTNYTNMPNSPIGAAVTELQSGVMAAAAVLGVAQDAFRGFSASIRLETKDMSEDQASAALEAELLRVGDAFAGMIPGLAQFQIEGEGATATLDRLVLSLGEVNSTMEFFGRRLFDVSIYGAGAAAELAQMLGGLAGFTQAHQQYFDAFYTESERVVMITGRLESGFMSLGLVLPRTRAGVRALVDSLDLTTQAGREAYAAILSMSAQLDQVLPQFDSLGERLGRVLGGMVEEALAAIDAQIVEVTRGAQEARRAAQVYRDLARSLRDASSQALMAGVGEQARIGVMEAGFRNMLKAAREGDQTAMRDLGRSATSLVSASLDMARDDVEARRMAIAVSRDVAGVAGVADALAQGSDYQAMLFDVNRAMLEVLREDLEAGNVTIDLMRAHLEALQGINRQIADSAQLQIAVARTEAGTVVAGLLDGSGRVIAGLSSETARSLEGLQGLGLTFRNGLTDQTMDLDESQRLTQAEIEEVAALQSQNIDATDSVGIATGGSSALLGRILNRLEAGTDSPRLIGAITAGNDEIVRHLSVLSAQVLSERTAAEVAELNARGTMIASAMGDKVAGAVGEIDRLTGMRQAQSAALAQLAGVWDYGTHKGSHQEVLRRGNPDLAWLPSNMASQSLDTQLAMAQAILAAGDTRRHMMSSRGWAAWQSHASAFRGISGSAMSFARIAELQSEAQQRADTIAMAEGEKMQALRNQIVALGGVPAFAAGGLHAGGLRIVGERGPELEVTGPSRIINANDTRRLLSTARLEREMQKMREEMAAYLRQISLHTSKSERQLSRWDIDGLPQERV